MQSISDTIRWPNTTVTKRYVYWSYPTHQKGGDPNILVAVQFNKAGHDKTNDLQISFLECIKRASRSLQAITIHHRVE